MNFRSACGPLLLLSQQNGAFLYQHIGPAAPMRNMRYITKPRFILWRIHQPVSGSLLEPVSIAVHTMDRRTLFPAVRSSSPAPALSVSWHGTGDESGATKVMVSEPIADKRAMAAKFGADLTVDPQKEIVKIGKDFTEGRGFDTVIEASGNLGAAKQDIIWRINAVLSSGPPFILTIRKSGEPFYMYANELTIRSVFHCSLCSSPDLWLVAEIEPGPNRHRYFSLKEFKMLLKTINKASLLRTLLRMY